MVFWDDAFVAVNKLCAFLARKQVSGCDIVIHCASVVVLCCAVIMFCTGVPVSSYIVMPQPPLEGALYNKVWCLAVRPSVCLYIPFCYCLFIFIFTSITTSMARNSLLCADVPLRNYSHRLSVRPSVCYVLLCQLRADVTGKNSHDARCCYCCCYWNNTINDVTTTHSVGNSRETESRQVRGIRMFWKLPCLNVL